ncbi:hypothetical protein ABZ297_24420 [Nonomuraea sp. NPDC005983]|uniref:hypothetical protein n=1 Tax=Nonomuraea sp. NPDC005983 TaxID=3155595 RepID=UPI0033BC37EF
MSAEAAAIAAHAVVLQSDARALTECAERLHEIEARLEAGGLAPPWLREAVNAHLVACVAAAADLTTAAAHLRRYAERARS